MTETSTPIELFCSYADADEAWLRKLETHLSLLKRQGLISLWYDRLIVPGTDWAKTIDTHLETASIILLLVSADFFASDYCYGIEMKRALERQEAREARVIPILVRSVDWTDAPFAHLQALPTDTKPISSWQDEDAALADIAAGIRRVIVEELPRLPTSALRAALPAIWNIPYSRNPFFLGRESELAQMRQRLVAGQAMALSQPQAISGLGGIGKTQLALAYAYQYHQDYTVVWWVRAESAETFNSSYIALAERLRLPEREAKEQGIVVQAIKTWLQTHRDWLLILDNADDLALLSDFLPPTLGGHLLLTTRAAATGRLAQRLEIDTLLPEDGALFLLRRAALLAPEAELSQASQEEQKQALQITQELGGLPLALDQAGAYLEETGTNLASYWQIYQQHHIDLLQRRGGLVNDHPASIATTWSLSFQKIEEKSPAAADLLRLCAFLVPHTIPEEILTIGASSLGPMLAPVAADAFLLNQAIETLRAYSLLRRDPEEKILLVHRLLQTVIQGMQIEAEKSTWAKRTMLAVNAAFPHAEYDTWLSCERLLPHAFLVAQYIKRHQFIIKEAGQLLQKMASYLQDRANYSEAEAFYHRALDVQEQLFGADHPDIAYLLNSLADVENELGKYVEAESFYQRAVHILEKSLGSDHPDVAFPLNGLANLYHELGKYAEAESLYQRAIHIREQALEPDHPLVAKPLNGLALLYQQQGRYAEAESLYQRTVRIREQALGPDHPRVAHPLNGLADLYREQGRYIEAESLYQRVLDMREKVQGPNHPDVAFPLNGLGNLYHELGKYTKAESLYQRALGLREQMQGPEHPLVAYPLNGLANLYREQGKYAEAEVLYQRALAIRKRHLGSHPDTAETMYDLAQLREIQGANEEARDWYAHTLAIREQALGVHHSKTTEARTHLIALLHAMGQHEEAAQLEAVQSEL